MEDLLSKVEELMDVVTSGCEKKHGNAPTFSSDFEGLAVIAKEVSEAREEIAGLMGAYRELKKLVFEDDTSSEKNKAMVARQMRTIALFGACELIQVSAMCRKFEGGKIGEFV